MIMYLFCKQKHMFKKSLGALALVAGVTTVVGFASAQLNTIVEVELLPGTVSIFSTGAFDFGNYTVSSSAQTVTGAFTSYFSVEDLKGNNSGYYTTVQMSGNLVGPGGATINDENVAMSTTTTGVTVITGTTNPRVVVHNGMIAFQSLDAARTLIKRDTAANFGVVGHYGTLPNMQVLIPAWTAVGTYTGTLVYTLYEN